MNISGNEICEMPVFGEVLLSGKLLWRCSVAPGPFAGLLCRVVPSVSSTRAPSLGDKWERNSFCLHVPMWAPCVELCPLTEGAHTPFSKSHKGAFWSSIPLPFWNCWSSCNNCAFRGHHGLCEGGWLMLGLRLQKSFLYVNFSWEGTHSWLFITVLSGTKEFSLTL